MRVTKFILLYFIFLMCACTNEKKATPSVEKISENTVRINDPQSVKIELVEKKQFPISIEFNGRITVPEKDLFSVSSRISGRLETVQASVGDLVRKNQSVCSVWSPDLAVAGEEYEIAKTEGGSMLKLTEQKLAALGVLPSDIQAGKTVFNLHSPIDGVVLERKLNAGSAVNPGDIILTVGKIGTLQFIGDFPSEQAIKIKKGMDVVFDEVKGLHATIESVSPMSDPNTHLVKVRARFKAQPATDIPQESFLKAHVIIKEISAHVFPAKSLLVQSDGEYVFVEVEGQPNVFKKVKINIVERSQTELAVPSDTFTKTSFKTISDGSLLVDELLNGEGGQD